MYVGLAALLAVIVLSVPGKIASVLRCSAYAVVALAFVACPWFGRAFEGRQQWLGLGPLFVHVASIGLPAFAVFSFSTIKRRQYARYAVVAGGVLVLLCLQRNLSDACLYVAVAILCALQWRPSWLLYASWCSSGLVGLVLLRRFLDGSSWEQVGLGALGAVFVRMVWVFTARERRGRDGVSSRWLRGMSLGSVLCTVLIVRELAGDGIPLLSAGASIMISVFMLFAIALRSLEPAQG
jgi:cell division protein FtsW (lipid II flippase)